MLVLRVSLTACVVVALLSACSSSGAPTGVPSAASTGSPSTSSSPSIATEEVASAQPDPLINLTCDDFAGVASIGTLAGVTEQDPRGVTAEILDPVPIADMVRNAGGLACEFSAGGLWRTVSVDGRPFNDSWHGIAFFILPNAQAWVPNVESNSQCTNKNPSTGLAMCSSYYAVGSTLLNIVVSSHDPTDTRRAAREHIQSIILAAITDAGPPQRAAGTWMPSPDCSALVPATAITEILGTGTVTINRPIQAEAIAEATFTTENVGCEWWIENSDTAVIAVVLPGGGWAAELTLAAVAATPVDLAGLAPTNTAASHCTDVSEWDYWICRVEVVVDGTWMRSIAYGADQLTATSAARALAEAVLAER